MSGAAPGGPALGQGELRLRTLSALVLGVGILLATAWGGWPFRLVWSLVAGLIAYEWLAMVSRRNAAPGGIGVALAGLALGFVPASPAALAGTAALAGLAGAALTTRLADQRDLVAACGIAYALVFAVVAPALREIPEIGLPLIVWSFATVWLTDIAAYFTGRRLGGPKLMPSVSPKKTWSGALGGAAAGAAGGYLVWSLTATVAAIGPMAAFAGSLLASIVAQGGDLFESAVKRRFGAKDSGRLIPGHGGFLDRLDGYWAVLVLCGLGYYLAALGA